MNSRVAPNKNINVPSFSHQFQGLVSIPIKHHPAIGGIISNKYGCFGDWFQPITKKGHQSRALNFPSISHQLYM